MTIKSLLKESKVSRMQTQEDEVLTALKEAVDPIVTELDESKDETRAVFIIAGKELIDEDGEYTGIQTLIDVAGDYAIIQEALNAELLEQISRGQPQLFQAIREVIKDIEQEVGLEEDDVIDANRILH